MATGFNPFGSTADLETVVRERRNDVAIVNDLIGNKLPGRARTNFRSVPTSATDVTATDREWDVIVDATYVYTLITVSGSLVWDRRAHSTGW